MIKAERFDNIKAELMRRGVIDNEELSKHLGVSIATIRRDLDEMEGLGLLQRTHGGATVVEGVNELPFHSKLSAYHQEKRAIGAMVAQLVPKGAVIGCTGGTTVMAVIKSLKDKPITILTNAINVAIELASSEGTEVIVTGGSLRARSYELVGHIADRTLSEFHLNIALIGVDGIDIAGGISTYTMAEAHTAALYISQAEKVWVVADHSKFGKIAPALIAPLSKVHRLITDSDLDPDIRVKLESAGVEVVLAEM
jgi:DeoR/GlpR family transcriptional regulator of sugar metabolism